MRDSRGTRSSKLFIYGDAYESKTRAIKALCMLSNITYEFKSVDVFRNQHKTKDYTLINPNQTVPCLKKGHTLILSLQGIFQFLLQTSP